MFCTNCANEIKEGEKFCTKCGNSINTIQTPQIKKGKSFFIKKKFIIGASIFVLLLAFLLLYQDQESATTQRNQDIASAVVNIYCTGATEEESSGGSGTIFSEDGLVLTNAHIIPQNDQDEANCLVILPDPVTGSADEIYLAYPIVVPELSETYDLAFIQIHDVYYDQEEGIAYGEYPKKFPAYDGNQYCKNENVQLGESVRIYGYPAISGGYSLTVTDGIVSSFPGEGLIITSAKISYGNSGGLAVDRYGCMIGIPSMVSGDENESLGVIISNDLISSFADEVGAIAE